MKTRVLAIYLLLLILFTNFSFIANFKSIDVYAKTTSGKDVIDYAKKFVGNPYKWGGDSLTNGCDCSGFVVQVYKNFGVDLSQSRSSSLLRTVGVEVPSSGRPDNMQAGDIMCYSGHVALYDGSGMIVEAKGEKYGITHDRAWDQASVITVRRIKNIGKAVDGGSSDSDSAVTAEQRKEAQENLSMTDDQVKVWQAAWDAAKTSGLSEAAVAGIFGNLGQECSWNPKSVEKGGTKEGIGIAGFTDESKKKDLEKYCQEHCKHKKVDLLGFEVCSKVECQFLFLLEQAQGVYDGRKRDIKLYNDTYEKYKDDLKKDGYTLKAYKDQEGKLNTWDQFKKATDEMAAAVQFHNNYEASSGYNLISKDKYDRVAGKNGHNDGWFFGHTFNTVKSSGSELSGRPYIASQCKILFGEGSGKKNKVDKETAKNIATQAVTTGFWSEDDLSNYCRLLEDELPDLKSAVLESLGQTDTESLASWQDNIDNMNEKSGLFAVMRIIVVIFGILISVYGILLYLAYWIDRLNQFLPVRLLTLLTSIPPFKPLAASYDGSSTFNEAFNGEPKLVSHGNIIFVSGICVAVGVSIASGLLFKLVLAVIGFVGHLISELT